MISVRRWTRRALILSVLLTSSSAPLLAQAQTAIRVSKEAYRERYLNELTINGTSPLVGFQYGDPREPLKEPTVTVSGVTNSHKHICALIQSISGAYIGTLRIENPKKGPILTLLLPTEVVTKLSPHAAELALLVRASTSDRECRSGSDLLMAGWGTRALDDRSEVYALLNISAMVSATAGIKPLGNAQPEFCSRLEHRMGDLRINAQRFGSICILTSPDQCKSPGRLQIIVRSENRREAEVFETVARACGQAV